MVWLIFLNFLNSFYSYNFYVFDGFHVVHSLVFTVFDWLIGLFVVFTVVALRWRVQGLFSTFECPLGFSRLFFALTFLIRLWVFCKWSYMCFVWNIKPHDVGINSLYIYQNLYQTYVIYHVVFYRDTLYNDIISTYYYFYFYLIPI